MTKPYIINARGEKEPFSYQKVYRSARRVGASKKLAREIAQKIEKDVYSGAKTSDIFREVKQLLHQETPAAALRFNLKQGMRRLGPTGFPFEKYIAGIFAKLGFEVQLNQFIPGACSKYEIDFLTKKEGILRLGECKYRNLPEAKIDINVALANYARFLDIENGGFFQKKPLNGLSVKSIIVTNTKFTQSTIRYSQCVGVELLGWKYPKNKGLEYIVDTHKLYPITVLPSLSNYLAEFFAGKQMMLAQDIVGLTVKQTAREAQAPEKKIEALVKEAKTLLQNQ